MLVDVGTPDLETRMAILLKKCLEKGVALDHEILHYVASTIYSNIRELEGALNKIIAFHQFKNMVPSLESVKPILASFESENSKKTVTPGVERLAADLIQRVRVPSIAADVGTGEPALRAVCTGYSPTFV